MNNELYHYGVKGMKWGIRKDHPKQQITKKPNKKVTIMNKRQQKKQEKELVKKQKEWDDNVNKNWNKAYNRAADYSEKHIIPKINKKYENYDFSNLNDPKVKKIHDQYVKEYEKEFDAVFNNTLLDMFGERPR